MEAWVFPGQGTQRKGIGADLFGRFPRERDAAGEILGYSVEELCRDDPDGRLRDTQYAQPALYVVNALSYLDRIRQDGRPDLVAGHSLGEYDALLAAGCFDFETGLRLVQRRGELMGQARGGGMAAVLGVPADRLAGLLREAGAGDIDVANYNSPTQVVLSGPRESLDAFGRVVGEQPGARCVPLNVSAAFHSRYMAEAAEAFAEFVRDVELADPRLPVLSNVTAQPYEPGAVARLLVEQIRSPVRWWDCMCQLAAAGVQEPVELGAGRVLTQLWQSSPPPRPEPQPEPQPAQETQLAQETQPAQEAQRAQEPRPAQEPQPAQEPRPAQESRHAQEPVPPAPVRAPASVRPAAGVGSRVAPERLGSARFREDYGIRYAYLAGSMYHGVASADLVVRMGKAGLMGFFGAGGLPPAVVEDAIRRIQAELGPDGRYGMNLLHSVDDPAREQAAVELFLKHGVRYVEAAGFMQMTPPLVRFRFSGAHRDTAGRPVAIRNVVAKVSRPEVAAAFMRPPDGAILDRLVRSGQLTADEADVARTLPISDDVCVEADSGGHTDAGVALTLIPSMIRLRDEVAEGHGYPDRIRVGAAGGLGAPEALAAAFVLGADFVVTGSINQCSPEAGTSADVKDMLAGIDVQDTTYAPAGDMFELGARVQVVRKGTLFPARANKLYQVYRSSPSLDSIDPQTRRTLEETYFRCGLDEVWRKTRDNRLRDGKLVQVEKAERDPRQKMVLVFKWYFAYSTRVALEGITEERVNYQIHSGPAAGAFNRFARGTGLQDWRNRHVDAMAEALMAGASELLGSRFGSLAA